MRFWLVGFVESAPVRLVALVVRMVGWLVVLSAVVIWSGPAEADGDVGRAVLGLVVGAGVWAVGMLPRWLVHQMFTRGCCSASGRSVLARPRPLIT